MAASMRQVMNWNTRFGTLSSTTALFPEERPMLRPFRDSPLACHLEAEMLIKTDVLFCGGFKIGWKPVLIRLCEAGLERGCGKTLFPRRLPAANDM